MWDTCLVHSPMYMMKMISPAQQGATRVDFDHAPPTAKWRSAIMPSTEIGRMRCARHWTTHRSIPASGGEDGMCPPPPRGVSY